MAMNLHTGGRLPRGLFLNCPAAPCSIHESGRMFFDAVADSTRYELDYAETDGGDQLPEHYDFYLFNHHHATMPRLRKEQVDALPGWKATFVLEVEPGDPFVLAQRWFDAYLVPDPTLDILDPRVFAFPRPLERAPALLMWHEPPVPVIGSFGFATPGKGFDRVVQAVNTELEQAVVRLNIPFARHGDQDGATARDMAEACRAAAKPGVRVEVSHEFLDKPALIRWCAQNTLNCFFYHRRQPGLAATTDQAIAAGRPLLVSDCDTFRHIHPYLPPYPQWGLRDAIARAAPQVARLQQDWAPARFRQRLEEVMERVLLLRPSATVVAVPAAPARVTARPASRSGGRTRVLFVSHPQQQCGIQQYGREVVAALRTSDRIEVGYAECQDAATFRAAAAGRPWDAFVYNYYPFTMPWLCSAVIHETPGVHMGIMHEVTQLEADTAGGELFDAHIAPDPTLRTSNPRVFTTGRIVPRWRGGVAPPARTTIGTFGFGVHGKGLCRLVLAVQEELDDAVIRMHLPANAFVDAAGEIARRSVAACRALIQKPGIELHASHDFLEPEQVLEFLAGNSLNAFCYDHGRERGISSAIEKALAVDRPIAITRCGMFRHVWDAQPSICLEDRRLADILRDGTAPLRPFQERWTAANLVRDYEAILDRVRSGVPA
jgi:hypothetical protein